MLINCFNCGKTISSKKNLCVYCSTNVSQFTAELNINARSASAQNLKEKYAGTLFSFLLKTKTIK